MSLAPGTRIGPYDVAGPLGAGGMGEVYRATDTKLKRQVAIKILPPALAADTDRLARFQREAEVLASLNHPNIAGVHGLEESGGITALVMELVEGDDLSQRIARGAMPLDEALPIAKQIAEALEAAHEQGIIHRDLKPANIKVRADGTVKVLDFGLAKALDTHASSGAAEAMNSPTITSPAMTQAGMILGTAAYMAPEQARGKTVDRRADIWAFGAVLFEMLTGKRAFRGEDVTDTIVSVISKEPDWTTLPTATPVRLRQLLTRCLKKDARTRLQAIGDARVQLDELLSGAPEDGGTVTSSTHAAAASARGLRPLLVALAVLAALVAAMAMPALRHLRETPAPMPPETRVDIVTPDTALPMSFVLSPDGRQIAFVASDGGNSRLWVRSLATTTAAPLPGTEGATRPFWSPDGRSLGFFTSGELKRINVDGGAPQTLAAVVRGAGGSWSVGDVIAFAPGLDFPLMRVSATGGATTPLTTLLPQHLSHEAPSFLPDGRRFLFAVGGAAEVAGVYLGALDGEAATRLTDADGGGGFLPGGTVRADVSAAADANGRASGDSGWLVWTRAATLVAQRLDVERAVLTGTPVTVADGVGHFSTATTAGQLAYRSGGIGGQQQLLWVDRTGKADGTVSVAHSHTFGVNPQVSPDGRRVALRLVTQGNFDVWVFEGGRTSRLTSDTSREDFPVWSPDGSRVVYFKVRDRGSDLLQRLARGGPEEPVVVSDRFKLPTSWSADGRFLMYQSTDAETKSDLWVVPMTGERTPRAFLKTPFIERFGAFSPDGRWVTYQSNETGRNEIYVRPFVPNQGEKAETQAGGQWQVSSAGGIMPTWRPDGRAIYFLSPTGMMMVTPIRTTGATVEPGSPVELFNPRIFGGGVDAQQGRQYDVARDGRFLINTVLDEAPGPITLIQNWNPEAKQ